MSGKQIEVTGQTVTSNSMSSWSIRMEMVLSEDDIVGKVLTKYLS